MIKSLKEWASVVAALESGEQTVILRKGGILEAASGFKLESEEFLLYRTAEHQGHANIKEQFHHMLEQPKAEDGHNRITSYARVLAHADIYSRDTLDGLSGFHIWSDEYISQRVKWKAEKPIKAVFLRVYRIPEITIQVKPEYSGCRSWIDMDMQVPDGEPVLDDAEADSRLDKFKEITN